MASQIKTLTDKIASHHWPEIGSIYYDWSKQDYYIGPLVHPEWYVGRRLQYPVSRGPFRTLSDFLRAYVAIIEHEASDPSYLPQPMGSDFGRERIKELCSLTVQHILPPLTKLINQDRRRGAGPIEGW
jgi:hypothetical protein